MCFKTKLSGIKTAPLLYRCITQFGPGVPPLVGKPPPQHRPQLRHLFGRMELIQTGHERILQGIGNRHAPERPGQRVVARFLPQQGGLQQNLAEDTQVWKPAKIQASPLLGEVRLSACATLDSPAWRYGI